MSLGWIMDDIIMNLFLNQSNKQYIRHHNNLFKKIKIMRSIFIKYARH